MFVGISFTNNNSGTSQDDSYIAYRNVLVVHDIAIYATKTFISAIRIGFGFNGLLSFSLCTEQF